MGRCVNIVKFGYGFICLVCSICREFCGLVYFRTSWCSVAHRYVATLSLLINAGNRVDVLIISFSFLQHICVWDYFAMAFLFSSDSRFPFFMFRFLALYITTWTMKTSVRPCSLRGLRKCKMLMRMLQATLAWQKSILIAESQVDRSRNIRHAIWKRWTLDDSVQCFRTERVYWCSFFGTCVGIRISSLGIRDGIFRGMATWHAERCVWLQMPIICHIDEADYLRRLLCVVWNFNVACKYHGFDVCCFKDPIDGFYLLKVVHAWWSEMEFGGLQRYHARGPRFVGWHSLKMFELPLCERNDFYTPVPHDWKQESNHCLEVPTPMMFSLFTYHLRTSGPKVRKYLVALRRSKFRWQHLLRFCVWSVR